MKKTNVTKQALGEILDLEFLDTYINQIYTFTNIPITILDEEGKIVIASEWIDLCKKHMRTNGITSLKCNAACSKINESGHKIFKCPNGLCMYSVPIKIGKDVVAYLVLSQFLMEKPDIEFFCKLFEKEGEDKNQFLSDLSSIPVVSNTRIQEVISFLDNFVLLLHNMIEKKVETKELEEEIVQNYEELEASYQDISGLNEQLILLNSELNLKNNMISTKEKRYRVLIEKMKQGTLVLKKSKKKNTEGFEYQILEMNPAMKNLKNKKELFEFVIQNVDRCLNKKQKLLDHIGNMFYEMECTLLADTEIMVCVTDITEVYEKLNIKRKQMWELVTAMGKLVEKRDLYTADHQKKVAILATKMAIELKLSDRQIESVYIASMLHDIGKISIPAEILTKPDKLTNIEYELMKTHVSNANDILRYINFALPITEIVMQHHERIDGSGYPEHLTEENIIMEAKIVAVADVYEAITSHRPYRPSLGCEYARKYLDEEAGILYDISAVNACKKMANSVPWEIEDVEKYLRMKTSEMFELQFDSV